MELIARWAIGLAAAATVALLARSARALSGSGAMAAAVCGALAVAAGWDWASVLIAYFVSSTLLSRFRASAKARRTEGRVEKGGSRDAVQVLANGGVFAAASLGYSITRDPTWYAVGAAGLAASAADTWATEVGTLAKRAPVSILDWKPVAVGTSGGVTLQGFAAATAGAAFVSLACALAQWPAAAVGGALVGGVAGCVLDSVLGAAAQARRWCPSCELATEQRTHRCGTRTTVVGGLPWLDNDGVNAISSLGGALVGTAIGRYL